MGLWVVSGGGGIASFSIDRVDCSIDARCRDHHAQMLKKRIREFDFLSTHGLHVQENIKYGGVYVYVLLCPLMARSSSFKTAFEADAIFRRATDTVPICCEPSRLSQLETS